MWTQKQAVALCTKIEAIAPKFGCHVAMTGGCLYKKGKRKDLDLIFYRIRHIEKIAILDFLTELRTLGFTKFSGGGWRYVAQFGNETVDLLFPEIPF